MDDAYLDSLQTITPTEQNLVDFLSILYRNVADETDIDAIREIAKLCPYTDGFGVYMARAWILQYDGLLNLHINECESSPDPGSFKWSGDEFVPQQQLLTESSLSFKLYPNPNNGLMVFEYEIG